ncbi:hypothetical protein [Actinopolymorpha pittospori]|uniref:Uncharacterized protein (UPF0128 family) n=1 Tax=Actinopolymorpha pittospori TaxID=648752 RepID=A0A927MS94_9ACTN|nr:hypothetical protein [Actinopolymorpha pittospori]MBE1605960.1 uncharacterized protein (UPF0128 family) [Actinopolymorpha pittospori]
MELKEVPLAHYEQLADRCRRVLADSRRLSDDLGLRRVNGAMYGYHAIARNLYDVLTDPSLPRELRPRDT